MSGPGSRRELKYVLGPCAAERLAELFERRLTRDPHWQGSAYPVFSLYYDTADGASARASVDGAAVRSKRRLRHYGDTAGAVFAEVKRRRGPFIFKERRAASGLPEAAVPEWAALGLRPRLWIRFDRQAWEGPAGFRVTLDRGLAYAPYTERQPFAMLASRARAPRLSGRVILEVKCGGEVPLAMRPVIEGLRPRRTSISKYAACWLEHTSARSQ
jgi:hypothetical protein